MNEFCCCSAPSRDLAAVMAATQITYFHLPILKYFHSAGSEHCPTVCVLCFTMPQTLTLFFPPVLQREPDQEEQPEATMPPKFKRHLNDDEVTGSIRSERVRRTWRGGARFISKRCAPFCSGLWAEQHVCWNRVCSSLRSMLSLIWWVCQKCCPIRIHSAGFV